VPVWLRSRISRANADQGMLDGAKEGDVEEGGMGETLA
jgi:hypothetical protein